MKDPDEVFEKVKNRMEEYNQKKRRCIVSAVAVGLALLIVAGV